MNSSDCTYIANLYTLYTCGVLLQVLVHSACQGRAIWVSESKLHEPYKPGAGSADTMLFHSVLSCDFVACLGQYMQHENVYNGILQIQELFQIGHFNQG